MRKKWAKPQVKVMKAGDAEAQRNVGNPDAKFGKPGGGGQYS